MTVSQSDLDDLLLHSGNNFTIVVQESNGSTSTYTGRDVTAFVQHQDMRNHSHRVTDFNGELVYSRDTQGIVQIGNAEQLLISMRREKMMRGAGKAATTGAHILADSTRKALRFWSKGLRG